MDVSRRCKRKGESCNCLYNKRLKSPSDDQDSETYSASADSTNSPHDSGFRENGRSSCEEPLGIHNDVCSLESKTIQTRLDNFEEKITWVVQELQMIRKTLEITTKAIQSTVSRPLLMPNRENSLQPVYSNNVHGNSAADQPSAIRAYPINQKGLGNINAPFAVHYPSSQVTNGCTTHKRDDYQSNGSSDEKVSSPEDIENRESHSETASKSLSDDYDSDSQIERGRISRDGNESNQSSRDWSVYNELMTTAPQLKNLHSDSISCLDVIYLWEYGTDEMLPIRLWNESELDTGGDVIKRWQQIMHLFKENCRGSLRTFVNKFTGADGKLMSVKEVLTSRGQDITTTTNNNNNLEVGENKHSDSYSVVSGSQSENGSKLAPYRGTSSTSNSSNMSLQCDSQHEPCFILPRKINGQKVSAKDVIRLWEEGFCNIPPIRSWTPSQKLKQQSKISRWKKIVDIFKTECNSDMKLFEMVYKNECGALLPIAAIISRHENSQSSVDVIGQPTMSNVATSTLDVKIDNFKASFLDGSDKVHRNHNFRGPYSRLHELAREWDLVEAQSCKERRAFAIRQVENWQRNIIQPHDNAPVPENLQGITLPKIFDEKVDSIGDRAVPHMNNAKIQDSQKIKNSVMARKEVGVLDSVKTDFIVKNPENSAERLQVNDGYNPIIRMSTCSEERKEQEESSMSDGSDNSSCKDIDVTGSISSESLAPSKSYSPVPSKLGKDLKSRSPVNPETEPQSSSMNQGTTGQSLDCVRVSEAENPAKVMYHTLTSVNPEIYNVLPETDDPIEVLNLWEHGNESYPPIRFLALKPELIRDSRLAAWRKFIGIFHYFCNGDKQILLRKYSDEHGRLFRVSEILQGFGSVLSQRQSTSLNVINSVANPIQAPTSSFSLAQTNDQLDMKMPRNDINIYTLPRKINGHKVSAKDVIHIWNHGLKNIPAVKSWLPNQKVRQQSKISRWKKIVEIFEVDCACNMQNFEKKYSNKAGDLLPIAAIIAKYEAEKTAIDGDSGLNIKIDTLT